MGCSVAVFIVQMFRWNWLLLLFNISHEWV